MYTLKPKDLYHFMVHINKLSVMLRKKCGLKNKQFKHYKIWDLDFH